ncbi:hypothetical protein IAT38_004183 [Cryptococcus sp. DSM 104549]
MSRQDKATTERNARILRDLVKQPDNKSCADCRKNDARWASWNLGVFLCIRCSGIHRSMGTHISKVKSIDLDIWTPEQMESMQKWGNRRGNLYWEKHLKAGHVPPDHKIESFIRSKYESRRWAMDGPPPRDPSELENGGSASTSAPAPQPTATSTAAPPVPASLPKTHPLLSRSVAHAKASAPASAKPTPSPIIDLFGDDTPTPSQPAPTQAAAPGPTQPPSLAPEVSAPQPTSAAAAPAPGSSIFDLDFRAPSASSSHSANSRPQTAKADIMSLFSSPSPAASAPPGGGFFNAAPAAPAAPVHAQSPYANWGGGVTSSAPPVQQNPTQAPVPTGGAQGWGGLQMDQSAWGAPPQPSQPQVQATTASANSNPWGGNPAASPAADPWASTGGAGAGAGSGGFFGASQPQVQAKKDDRDPFANIWG